jgi:phosphoglycolate phosphatase-like HAD superfamily hydrolase
VEPIQLLVCFCESNEETINLSLHSFEGQGLCAYLRQNWFHKELNVLQWANPVPSVRAALTEIKKMGHPLHIVTARFKPI